jgi:hypothetical protein
MSPLKPIVVAAMSFITLQSVCYAGPCLDQIGSMEVRINDKLASTAAAGPTGRQGRIAGMSLQPTPRSMAAAEEKLGELSPQLVEAVSQAMSRARAADTAGDKSACEQALAEVERIVAP